MKTLATVASVGAISPIGLRAIDTALSHRAAAVAMREAPLADDDGEPITMCCLPILDPLSTGTSRALVLAMRAMEEAIGGIVPSARSLRTQLVLNVDEHMADRSDGESAADRLAAAITARARDLVPGMAVTVLPRGAAGAGFAMSDLCASLASGAIEVAILGGVHTDYDPAQIVKLAKAGRLFKPDNLDALIPGEAAAFVVLVRPDAARKHGFANGMRIRAIATGRDKIRPDNDESAFRALGLTNALRTALAPLAEEGMRAGWLLTDLTFETFRHFEFQAATTRIQRLLCEPQQVENPAQRMGYLGAAAMPMHIALASEAFRRGFAPHPNGLSIAGSDNGERAVVLFAAPN